jgi:hypothetical protein
MDDVMIVVAALERLIANYGEAIEEIDINPLLIGSWGCRAVDALVVLADGRPEAPRP